MDKKVKGCATSYNSISYSVDVNQHGDVARRMGSHKGLRQTKYGTNGIVRSKPISFEGLEKQIFTPTAQAQQHIYLPIHTVV